LEIKYFSFKNLHFINFYRTFVPVLNMAVITPFIMEKKNIGEKILALCKSRNLSIQDLVDTTGLSEVQINRVIESETIPSLAPLIKIARALGVRLGTFLDDAEELGPVVHRSGEVQQPASFSSQLSDANSHLDFYALAARKSNRHMEPFFIDIQPSSTHEPIFSSHEGEEFIFVLEGAAKIDYGNQTFFLHPGDSIYYDSIINHLVSSADEKPAKILAVVYTPL
jgi:transcriptional regulator with XRE-family HTH domain